MDILIGDTHKVAIGTSEPVVLKRVFQGLTLETSTGERLSVTMRDSGFEVHYYGADDGAFESFDHDWITFNKGEVYEKTSIPVEIPEEPDTTGGDV